MVRASMLILASRSLACFESRSPSKGCFDISIRVKIMRIPIPFSFTSLFAIMKPIHADVQHFYNCFQVVEAGG